MIRAQYETGREEKLTQKYNKDNNPLLPRCLE